MKEFALKRGMEGSSWRFKHRHERWCLAIGQRCTCRSKSADKATIVCMNNTSHPLFNIKWYLKSAKISNCLWSNSIITKETMMKKKKKPIGLKLKISLIQRQFNYFIVLLKGKSQNNLASKCNIFFFFKVYVSHFTMQKNNKKMLLPSRSKWVFLKG
jgi:hypothetical protein